MQNDLLHVGCRSERDENRSGFADGVLGIVLRVTVQEHVMNLEVVNLLRSPKAAENDAFFHGAPGVDEVERGRTWPLRAGTDVLAAHIGRGALVEPPPSRLKLTGS